MKLTTVTIGTRVLRTKKEKINFLLEKGYLQKKWTEDFVDEDTGEVVTIEMKLVSASYTHPQLNKILKRHFK